jgi:aerobic-type carbon monoxide dehydrogenase small subunit (CoxS/CutS family)
VTKRTKQFITLRVNGEEREVAVLPNRTLLEVLREDLALTGTKEGCDDGVCGACTVLVDGKPVRACLLLAIQAQGREILTIEGLAEGGRLHAIQQAFVDTGAIQCGFCSPGMILTAKALLVANPHPTDGQIKHAISGNFCRCTGYNSIVKAIREASVQMRGGR